MLLPIVCLDTGLRQFLTTFRGLFSKPQFKYFVTILLGLMLCQETKTLSGLLRQVDSGAALSGASRFLFPAASGLVTGSQRLRSSAHPTEAAGSRHQLTISSLPHLQAHFPSRNDLSGNIAEIPICGKQWLPFPMPAKYQPGIPGHGLLAGV